MKHSSILCCVLALSLLTASLMACSKKSTNSSLTTAESSTNIQFEGTTMKQTTTPQYPETNSATDPTVNGTSLYPVRISLNTSSISEPYPTVSGGSFTGNTNLFSPDPLINYRWDSISADDSLQIFQAFPISYTTDTEDSFEGLDSVLTDDMNITVKGNGDLMFDFGVEFAAWLEIDSPDLQGAGDITLSVSEYTLPEIVNVGPSFPTKTAAPQKVSGNTYRLNLNDELYEGVRFGFIHIENLKQEFHITGIRLICQVKPTNYNGSFSSDNEMLNRIWYTAAYDVRVNLKQDYFAAILVDRGDRYSWTGDAYPAQAASLTAFANYDFVLQNLQYTAVRSNGIESYELYWVLSLIDYYEYTGDKNGVSGLLTQATRRLNRAYSIWGKNPSLGFFGWDERLGAGFENADTLENQLSYKVIAIECWNQFADVLDDLGKNTQAERYRSYATEKTEEILSDPDWYQSYGMHAFSDAVNAGIVSDEISRELFEKYFTNRVNRISYSPFNEYFILQALGKMDKYDDAISSILDLWGGQIEYGGTCFFETFRPDWTNELEENAAVPNNQAGYTSLAHPWGAGVLTWMSEELLGIKATTPGFSTFAVIPHLGTQLTSVSGEMPTPYGTITASFDITLGKHSITVPQGTVATFAVPKAGRTVSGLKINGSAVAADREDENYFYFDGLTEGSYEFTADYSGTVEKYEAPEWSYDATYIGTDSETQGNWSGIYGSDGYVFCGSSGFANKVLPDYVSSVIFTKGNNLTASADADDSRALQSNIFGIGDRVLSHYATNYNAACYQTFTVDINLVESHPYTVALYFVDWENEGKSLAVEMFNGETLELVAPVKTISDYAGGIYMIYEYDQSARFRIDHIRGSYVSLSGIFFGVGSGSAQENSYLEIDDTNSDVVYQGSGWHHDIIGDAYNGTFSYTDKAGAYCEYTFEGDNIALLASQESNRGICEIFIDGISQGYFDLYHTSIRRQEKIFQTKLEYGQHTIKVVVTGEKSKNSNGYYVDIDAFEIKTDFLNSTTIKLDERDKRFSYTGNWTHDPMDDTYNGTFSYSNVKGDAVEITFTGTAVRLISSLESNRGICEIFLDGVSQGTVDLYSPTIKRQQVIFEKNSLISGEHIIKMVVTGEKNSAASECYVDIDAVEITQEIYTLDNVLESVTVLPVAKDTAKISFSPIPNGFTVALTSSDNPDVIAADGRVTLGTSDTEVTLTLSVSKDNEMKTKTVTVKVPAN